MMFTQPGTTMGNKEGSRPIHPILDRTEDSDYATKEHFHSSFGLTLREYAAVQMAAAIVASGKGDLLPAYVVHDAVKYADELVDALHPAPAVPISADPQDE